MLDKSKEVVATRRRRKIKPRKQWKKYRRPGHGVLQTVGELAAELGETERTIRGWRAKGIIPVLVLGHKTIRFRLDDVLEALRKRRVK
jgi:hypothetical protein